MTDPIRQLISYIAPAAPATRRPAHGDEPYLRLEFGFTPAWYRQHLDLDFGERFHTDPAYRRTAVLAMRALLRSRFPDMRIGPAEQPDRPLDLLTGLYGACSVAAIFGVPIVYAKDQWPNCEQRYLSDEQLDRLQPPNLTVNAHFGRIMEQVDWIAASEGVAAGYINWQGVLNNAHRLRGQQLFLDMADAPDRARRLFDCVCHTMIDALSRLQARQRETGFETGFATVSNCLVNLISPRQYRELLLPFDQRIANAFGCLGIHNCAWSATPYLDAYARIPHVAYIDMGLDSDLPHARSLFPDARRAVMYPPTEVARKSLTEICRDLERIVTQYGPCDLVCADLDTGVSDERIVAMAEAAQAVSTAQQR